MEESVVAHGTLNVNAALVCAHRRHIAGSSGVDMGRRPKTLPRPFTTVPPVLCVTAA